MKKQYLAWGLAISLSIGTIFGNSGVSWAFENTNQDKTANVEKEESSFWNELGLLTPSNATEFMTSSNAATENTTNKPTETTGLKQQFTTEDGIIVEIDSQDIILPENTQIQVKKVDLGSEITDSVRSSMQENQKELEQIYAYDISFWSDGEEFEPSDGVKVTFKLPDTMTGEQVDESEIFHVKDGEDVAEFVPKTLEGDQEISCQSVGFSVYGIAVAQAEEWIPIYTAEEFVSIKNNLDGTYKLMNDIDLSEYINEFPLDGSDKDKAFRGTLDGNNHIITLNGDININNNTPNWNGSYTKEFKWSFGIFQNINSGVVRNIKFDGELSFHDTSILSEVNRFWVSDIIALNVLAYSISGYKAEITNIINEIDISFDSLENVTDVDIAPVACAIKYAKISKCINKGDIRVALKEKKSGLSYVRIGGLVDFTDCDSENNIVECLNLGDISLSSSVRVRTCIGGLISETDYSGGSVWERQIEKCANLGNINITFGDRENAQSSRGLSIGGLIGACGRGILLDCYNSGKITVDVKEVFDSSYYHDWCRIGGIVGMYWQVKLQNIYNSQYISGLKAKIKGEHVYVGEILGAKGIMTNADLHERENVYYLNRGTYSGDETEPVGTAINEQDMEQQSTFENFDFENVWKMGEGEYPYPILQFQNDVPQQPDNPDIPDSDEQLGWVKFENGKVGYYIYENNQCKLLKSGIYKLNYTDQNGVIFNGRWKFDENGYVMTGMHDGLYYSEDEDGLYPYGMCIPDKGLDGILKEEYNQSHIRPSTVLSRYSFISTYMDDMNDLSYILSAKIDDAWMEVTGDVFQRLGKQLGFVDIDDINVQYLMEESNNRKILAQVLDLKFPEKANPEDEISPVVVANAWSEVKDERGYAEFIAEKIADALKNEGKYSDSFNELAKEVEKKEASGANDEELFDSIVKSEYEVFDAIMKQVKGWSDALKDYSEKLSYLDALEASIDKIDSKKIKNIQKLKNAVSSLRNNYEERIKLQVFETCFAVIEQGNSWNEVVTGEKRPLAGWDFKENTEYNAAKIATDVIKDLGEGAFPLLKTFSQAITTIQAIDGRTEAVNTIAQAHMLYTVAYDVLREKEDKFLIDGNSENLADYLNAFEFMRCITLLRYQKMKAVYESVYNRDNLKQVKVDFLQKEIDKLQRISPLNYYENEFSPLTFAGSWDESGEKYYYGTNGDERFYIENRWAYIDGKRYYFDQNGRVLVGAQKITDETGEGEYYFSTGDGSEHNKDHRGAMQTGPIEINGKEYYYDSNPGVNRGRKVINSRIEIGPKDYRYYGPDGAYDREKSGFSEVTDTDPNHKFYDKGGIRYATNCPVDIIIYDENDNMVGKIVNDQVQNVTDDEIDVYIDSAGQKIVGVPQNGKYKLEIIARAAGTMDYSVAEFASDGSGLIGKTDYRAVTLNQADHFYGITESMFYDGEEHNSYRLLKENTEIELAEYQDTLTSYLINASTAGHGTVEGSKAAIRGDFAKLTAKPDSGYRFVGWYDKDGNCVSKELEFRFRVLEEQNFTAKFTVRGASDSGSDSSDDSDDTSCYEVEGVK